MFLVFLFGCYCRCESLTWNKHTSNVVNVRPINIICIAWKMFYLLKLYYPCITLSLIPHLTYCSLIWGDPNNTNITNTSGRNVQKMCLFSNHQIATFIVMIAACDCCLRYRSINEGEDMNEVSIITDVMVISGKKILSLLLSIIYKNICQSFW